MKRSLLILGLATLTAFAQDKAPPPPVEPVPAPPPAAGVEPATATPGKPSPPRASAKAKRVEAIAAPAAVAQAANSLDVVKSQVAVAGKSLRNFEFDFLPRSTKTGRTLIVQSVDTDPATIANAEEDMSVMALILRKATGGGSSDDKRMALGIEVDSTVFGSSSGARNIYVEGYGALFLLGVRFPLIAPQDKPDEQQTKDERSNDWKEAREEYLANGRVELEEDFQGVWKGGRGAPGFGGEEYDADKVEALKVSLLESLKNANHIRILKPTEYINVVIQGGEARIGEKTVTTRGGQANVVVRSKVSGRSDSRRGETVMTLRLKKSDVDAFASGALDYAGFRNKATIQTYLRRGDASVSTSPFRGQ
jgi:hypothetical protein